MNHLKVRGTVKEVLSAKDQRNAVKELLVLLDLEQVCRTAERARSSR